MTAPQKIRKISPGRTIAPGRSMKDKKREEPEVVSQAVPGPLIAGDLCAGDLGEYQPFRGCA